MVSLFGLDLDGAFDAIKGATSDLFQHLDLTGPQQQAAGGRDPFAGLQLGGNDPFKGLSYGNTAFDNLQLAGDPFAGLGGLLGGSNPQTGYNSMASFGFSPVFAAFDAAGQKVAAKQAAAEQERQARDQANVAASTVTQGGMEGGVAKWAAQAQQTFGDLGADIPDVMLAIMTNESHGNEKAYNPAGDAWGLFQQLHLNSNDPNVQFAAARQLAAEKLAGIDESYRRNGLSPDQRTRARDLALAWAGHFDYASGQPNPASRDVGSGQTAAQLANVFLANYDRIKAGRQQASAPGYQGAGGMASIWGGGNGPITQGYGAVTPGIDQGIYGYGAAYGLPAGHTGDDIGLPRGTNLYMPAGLTGVVEAAGGTPYFRDEDYGDRGTPGKGELRIRLSNGDILILGHTSQISVQAGQQLKGGDFVGLSGSANGDHLHLEVRVRQPDGSYRLMDPAAYFGNTGGGGASYR